MISVSYLIFTATVVFLVVFGLKLRKAKKTDKSSEDFWTREQEANFVRRVDPDTIEYLEVPLDSLPFEENPDKELKEIQDAIQSMALEKLLNLTGMTNTDIKFTYGTANFSTVSLCDQRFLQFSRTLYQWGDYLFQKGELTKAKTVLEYAVSCKSDISHIYTILADIYLAEETPEKITELTLIVEKLPTLMKASIIKALKEKLSSR